MISLVVLALPGYCFKNRHRVLGVSTHANDMEIWLFEVSNSTVLHYLVIGLVGALTCC